MHTFFVWNYEFKFLTKSATSVILNQTKPLRLNDKKEEIWPSPMTKAPTPTEMSKGQSDNINNATKKFD